MNPIEALSTFTLRAVCPECSDQGRARSIVVGKRPIEVVYRCDGCGHAWNLSQTPTTERDLVARQGSPRPPVARVTPRTC
jgi:uncharacterized Zn finger protein